jgi:S-adenosylmethionine decarboxylase
MSEAPERAVPAYFVQQDGEIFAGISLLIDVWGGKHLENMDIMRQALIDSATACGATMRNLDLFQFSEGGGIAGVAMLMQSHISVHSWPEHGYGAFDAFVCCGCDPLKMIPVLQRAFEPERIEVSEHRRGLLR